MDDESISESMLAITVAEAKQAIKDKKFVRLILSQHNKFAGAMLSKLDFTSFMKVYLPSTTDNEASELFNFLTAKKKDTSGLDSDRENLPSINKNSVNDSFMFKTEDRLDVMVLETHFEKWFREEDSLQAFLNPKVAKQRFADFKTKIQVWRQRDKQRGRLKKVYKKHNQKLR